MDKLYNQIKYIQILHNTEIKSEVCSFIKYNDNIKHKNYFIFITIIYNNNSYYLSLFKYKYYKKRK